MTPQPSIIKDFFHLLFSPRKFFEQRFVHVSSRRIFVLGFIGVFFGILVGNVLTLFGAQYVLEDFTRDQTPYVTAFKSLGLDADSFTALIKAQFAYSVLLICLSPVIAYIAPHLFGGALYFFMWLLYRPNNEFAFQRVMECAAIALTAVAFYAVPGVGALIALILVGVNTSRAITTGLKLVGFLKVISIISAMYICFFLTNASLQLLAEPVGHLLATRFTSLLHGVSITP